MKSIMDEYVVSGPPLLEEIPSNSIGEQVFNALQNKKKSKDSAFINLTTNESITFEELYTQSVKTAIWLRSLNIKQGKTIAICSENNLRYFIATLAGFYNGAIISTINNNFTVHEIQHTMNIIKPSIIFCSQAQFYKFHLMQMYKTFNLYTKKIIILEKLEEQINHIKLVSSMFVPLKVDTNDTALIMFSSGTTGMPKGVMLTHRNISARGVQSRDPRLNFYEDNNYLVLMPFFHAYAFNLCLGNIMHDVVRPVLYITKFEPNVFLKTIEKYRLKILMLVPSLVVFLARSPLVDNYDLSSVESIFSGAAPLSKETENIIRNRFPHIKRMAQGYGLTEATLSVLAFYVDLPIKPGSCGKVVPGTQIKLRDPVTGKSVGPNQSGEICIKSPFVMKGYYNDPKATKATFENGWLLTGDVAYYDEDGYFYIVDRLKELIKYKGYQVAPAEIEAVLISHVKIEDAGVIGIPDEKAGEIPVAFIVKQAGVELTEAEVIEYVAEMLSDAKQLRGGVRFTEVIPRNPGGKVLRKELRKMFYGMSGSSKF